MREKILTAILSVFLCASQAYCQIPVVRKIQIKKGLQVTLRDTTFLTKKDTTLFLTEYEAERIRIKENPYEKSSKFYDSLTKRAASYRVTKDILELVVKRKGRKEKLVNVLVKSEDVFKPFTGYTIRSIVFKSVDLLEGSVIDTLQKASTRLGKLVNHLHKDTRARIIEQNLLFKKGDAVDPYRLADNERLLRQFKTLRDARIYIAENKKYPKEVDVVVVTQDVASIGVSGDYSSLQKFRLDVYDINIVGYAKQLQVSYFRNSADFPKNGYEITLREPNILGTFAQGELQYTENYLRQRTRLAMSRDFFTPEINYAGGLELFRTRENFYFEEYDTLEIPYTENSTDVWAGRSFEFKKRSNLIFSARANARYFIDKPFVSSDSNSFFYDRTLLLGNVSLTKRNFLKSLRIRGFGKTEDVPIGGSISLLFGNEINEFTDRSYLGLNTTYGKYFTKIGYVNLSFATGSFIKKKIAEDGLISVSGTYFSDLVKFRRTQIRQFIYTTYTKGFNRIVDRTIQLNGKWFNELGTPPLGNERLTIGFETVYFMPWYAYGFQFTLFHRVDLNLLALDTSLFSRNTLFPTVRTGVRMLNENLVLPTLSIELGYFGKNKLYSPAWEFRFSTTLPNLFGTGQNFKPQVAAFN